MTVAAIEDALIDLESVIDTLERVADSIRREAPKVAVKIDQRADALRSDHTLLSLSLPRPAGSRQVAW